ICQKLTCICLNSAVECEESCRARCCWPEMYRCARFSPPGGAEDVAPTPLQTRSSWSDENLSLASQVATCFLTLLEFSPFSRRTAVRGAKLHTFFEGNKTC